MPTFQCPVGDRPLIVETGKLAGQADGAITVRYGDTVVLVTACMSKPREGIDFLPLTIDFEERLYAAGKIPGGFFRREGRPTQDATLAARLTDRPLRPLFPKGFRNDTQVVITVLSADLESDPDILGIIGASAALSISSIPFLGPVAAVRVGYIGDQWVINPTFSQLQDSLLEVVVAGTHQAVMMLEAAARQASEPLIIEAIRRGQQANQEILRLQEDMVSAVGKPKVEFQPLAASPEATAAISSLVTPQLDALLSGDKAQREGAMDRVKEEVLEKLQDTFPREEVSAAFDSLIKGEVRRRVLATGVRLGGRAYHQLRPISAEVGVLPRTHGSGLFTRGGTQVLTIATLASKGMEQQLDGISPEESKRFIHHYNFPPYSTGEVRRMVGPGRREVGHGALVEKALFPVLPDEEAFPYTIRLVSEVLSSNGSTSMASVCGSSMALMDAGVPIKTPVAGVAMGLLTGDDKYAVLTDIEGVEDAYGDMDFKVAGTAQGITALQLDMKLPGIELEVLEKALAQAKDARLIILDKVREAIPQPRSQVNAYAPKIYRIKIEPEKIGNVIGTGGKTIRSIIERTKASVDVEDDGTVYIGAVREEQAQEAIKMVQSLTREVEVGTVYTGRVTRLLSLGAMVEIFPGKEGLVPMRELAEYQVRRPGDVVKVGDEIMVKVTEIDPRGRVNLSRRAVFEGLSYRPAPPRREETPPGPRPSGHFRPFSRPRRPPPPQES